MILSDSHDLSRFHSYEQELVNFLRKHALHDQKHKISLTFLWFYGMDFVGYITLLNDKLTLNSTLRKFFTQKEIFYNSLPALKIGRLCVDDRYIGRGIGKIMVQFAIDCAKKINMTWSGCRFLTLDAKRGIEFARNPVLFYKKNGFCVLKEKENSALMYLDLESLNDFEFHLHGFLD